MRRQLHTIDLAHDFLAAGVGPGASCVDATAGRGRDTVFLCELVGPAGRVAAFDIQQAALDSTAERLLAAGLAERCRLICAGHERMADYLAAETVDGILFNLGYLPGGDHRRATRPETTIAGIAAGLNLLRAGGRLSICIYHGGDSGYEERDRVLSWLKSLDWRQYTVLTSTFHNRPNDPPIHVGVLKHGRQGE